MGCELLYHKFAKKYMVEFNGVKGTVLAENFADQGNLSVGVSLKKLNGEEYNFSGILYYVKQGSRLEIDTAQGKSSQANFPSTISIESFKEIFGPLPNIECSLE